MELDSSSGSSMKSDTRSSISEITTAPAKQSLHLEEMDFYDLLKLPRVHEAEVDKEVQRRFADIAQRHGQDMFKKVSEGGPDYRKLSVKMYKEPGPENNMWRDIAMQCFCYWQWKDGMDGLQRWLNSRPLPDDVEYEDSDHEI